MKCGNCGADTQGKVVCPICGAKIIGIKKCHVCETTIFPGMKECPNCGTPFHVEKNEFDHIPQIDIKPNKFLTNLKKNENVFHFTKKNHTYQKHQSLKQKSILKWIVGIISICVIFSGLLITAMSGFIFDDNEYGNNNEYYNNEEEVYIKSSLLDYDYNFSRGGKVFSDGYWTYISKDGTYVNEAGGYDEYFDKNYSYFGVTGEKIYAIDDASDCYVEIESGEAIFTDVKMVYNYHGCIYYLTLDNELYRYDLEEDESYFIDENVDDFLVDYGKEYVIYEKSGEYYIYSEMDDGIYDIELSISSLKDGKAYIQESVLFYKDDNSIKGYSFMDEDYFVYTSVSQCDDFYYSLEDETLMYLKGTTLTIDEMVVEDIGEIYFADGCLVAIGDNCYSIYDYINDEDVHFYER